MFVSNRTDPLQMMRQVADAEFCDSDSDDDNSTSHGGVSDVGGPTENKLDSNQGKEFSAKDAARATNCVGYVVLCLLVFTGGILSILTHFFVQGEENESFEKGVSCWTGSFSPNCCCY